MTTQCTIIIRDEVFGRHEEIITPQTATEAMDNHGLVVQAAWFALRLENLDPEQEPLGVAVHRYEDKIIVHYYPRGPIEAARAVMVSDLDRENHWGAES